MVKNYLYNKQILEIIDDCISCGYPTYSSLDESDVNKLTAMCISVLGDDCYASIMGLGNLSEIASKFVIYLKDDNKENAFNFAQIMKDTSNAYFHDDLKQLYRERFHERRIEENIENGLQPYMHKDNGEITWIIK